jgi:hypothetical protein
VSAPFLVEASGATGIPIIWTGEVDVYGDGGFLYDVDMAGVGTANFFPVLGMLDDSWVWVGVNASLTGVAVVTPEPSTLTLIGIAVIASIVVIGFRRRYSNA